MMTLDQDCHGYELVANCHKLVNELSLNLHGLFIDNLVVVPIVKSTGIPVGGDHKVVNKKAVQIET